MSGGTRRWALRIEYDGGPFVGWQRQAAGVSVQDVLEAAVSRIAHGAHVPSIAAGRTDAGVHAAGQVASVDLVDAANRPPWQGRRLCDALNFHMKPHPVAVTEAAPAPAGWSPRFSAVLRAYRYTILNRHARPAIGLGRVWHVNRRLDLAAMQAAAALLVGRHDFTSFRATACQAKSPVRTLDRLEVVRSGELVTIEAEARSFLHHQIRNIAGTLALVGEGRWTVGDVAAALEARDRAQAGPTAPPAGLCLLRVEYPADADPFLGALPTDPRRDSIPPEQAVQGPPA